MNVFSVLELDKNHSMNDKLIILASLILGAFAYIFIFSFFIIFNYLFYFSGVSEIFIGLDSSWLYNLPFLYTAILSYIYYLMFKQRDADQIRLRLIAVAFGQLLATIANMLILIVYLQKYYQNFFNALNTIYDVNIIFFITIVINALVSLTIVMFLATVEKEKLNTFGGAEQATLKDLKKHNLIVPKDQEKITPNNKYICYGELEGKLIGTPVPKNTCIFSPPGGGKGVTSVMPKLLDSPFPLVINDAKFENAMGSVEYRERMFGKKAAILDPYNVALNYDAKKWGDRQTLHIDLKLNGDVDMDIYVSTLANAIAPKDASGKNTSFYTDAQMILEGVLYYLVASEKNITEIFDITVKKGLWHTKALIQDFNDTLEEESPAIYLAANKIKQLHEKGQLTKYGADVEGILVEGIKLFGQSALRSLFEKGDESRTLKLDEYLAGDVDIYIVVPSNMIEQTAPFIKLVLGLVKSALEFATPNQLKAGYYPMLLDEVAQLGYMKILEQMYEILRYKGIVLWLYFQDLSQLKVFAKAEMFKGFTVLQFFEVNGEETIEFIKKLAGTRTIEVESIGKQKKKKLLEEDSKSSNKSLSKTELLSTDAIREMSANKQIIFYTGCPVIVCDRTPFYSHKRYKGLAADNLTRIELAHLIPEDNQEQKDAILKARKESIKDQANEEEKLNKNQIKKFIKKLVKKEKSLETPEFLVINEEGIFISQDVYTSLISSELDLEAEDYLEALVLDNFFTPEEVEEEILFRLEI